MKNQTDIKLQFIGTASGVTSLSRYHSSFVIKLPGRNILVDAGDSVCKALLNSGYRFNDITDIIFTHFHADHVSGIAPLLTQMKIIGRTELLTIFCPEGLVESLRYYLEMTNLFTENFGYEFSIVPVKQESITPVCEQVDFEFIQNSHIKPKELHARKYDIPFISGSLFIRVGETKIFYTSDIGEPTDLHLYGSRNINLYISEATHVDAEEIARVWDNSGAEKLILTHYEDENFDTLKQFCKNKSVQGRLAETAYDGFETFLH